MTAIGDHRGMDRRQRAERNESISTAGQPSIFTPVRGKFIPPTRLAQQRRDAVGIGSKECFYHGAQPMPIRSRYMKGDSILGSRGDQIVVPNTKQNNFKTVYGKDYGNVPGRDEFVAANSQGVAFGKVPDGGFIKYHDVEQRKETGNISAGKYKSVYEQQHIMGCAREDIPKPINERNVRRPVNTDEHHSLGLARERRKLQTLNFSELPGQELNPKPIRRDHAEFGDRNKNSHIAWDLHG